MHFSWNHNSNRFRSLGIRIFAESRTSSLSCCSLSLSHTHTHTRFPSQKNGLHLLNDKQVAGKKTGAFHPGNMRGNKIDLIGSGGLTWFVDLAQYCPDDGRTVVQMILLEIYAGVWTRTMRSLFSFFIPFALTSGSKQSISLTNWMPVLPDDWNQLHIEMLFSTFCLQIRLVWNFNS